ncbi:MAG: hypothetical protein GY817_03320 [bacterium]|nr:hypothetical protein [bacterium]
MAKIEILGTKINSVPTNKEDYISLTDRVKNIIFKFFPLKTAKLLSKNYRYLYNKY